MYYVIDQFGEKVHADNINISNRYTCPACADCSAHINVAGS